MPKTNQPSPSPDDPGKESGVFKKSVSLPLSLFLRSRPRWDAKGEHGPAHEDAEHTTFSSYIRKLIQDDLKDHPKRLAIEERVMNMTVGEVLGKRHKES